MGRRQPSIDYQWTGYTLPLLSPDRLFYNGMNGVEADLRLPWGKWRVNARISQGMEQPKEGRTVTIRPRGQSMAGKVNDGDIVVLEPVDNRQLQVGDVVLAKVRRKVYLHLIKAIQDDRYLIGNNRGGTNGWVTAESVFGIATSVRSAPSGDPN